MTAINEWFYKKSRRHHNRTGSRKIRNGGTRKDMTVLARRMGVSGITNPDEFKECNPEPGLVEFDVIYPFDGIVVHPDDIDRLIRECDDGGDE